MPVLRLLGIIIAIAAMALPAWAETITGTVTYRERIALPQGAQLRVTLLALPSGQQIAGASASIPAKGQVPLAFSLNVHTPLTAQSYGLRAEIWSRDQALFRNGEPVPVDPAGGVPIEILVQPAPARPTSPLPAPPSGLIDTLWSATSIAGKPVIAAQAPTLAIAADLRATGTGSCNNYFAEASVAEAAITFGPAAATNMACPAEIMAQESAYFVALAAVASFELDSGRLRLLDAAGVPLIGFVGDGEE